MLYTHLLISFFSPDKVPLPLSSLLEPPVLCLISTELPLPLSDLEREMMELRKEEPAVMLPLPGLGACHGTGGGHQLTATCTQQYDLCRHATTITARKYFTLFVRRAVHISGLRHRITRRLESSYLYLSPGWRGEAALRHQLSLYTLPWSRWQRGSGGRTANLSPDLRLLPSTMICIIHTATR